MPVFWLNRAGIPVAQFGRVLALVLFFSSVGLLWRFRPKAPWQDYFPFACIFLLGLFMTGRPMLEFGFDWLSYANDDMATYCLGAHRFLKHGFFDIPNQEDLVNGQDYTLVYWFLHVAGGVRPGVELFLAWVVSLTGLMADQIFMPVTLAFHLVLISAAGAMVCQSSRLCIAALLTCLLLSLSALTSLGAIYQLIAQVSGLGLLAGCIALLLRPFKGMKTKTKVLHCVLSSILISGLLITYPEVSPFLILAFLLYALIGIIQRRLTLKPLFTILSGIGLGSLVILNTYLIDVVRFLIPQTSGGLRISDPTNLLFPYLLIPSGLANLWGMQSIAKLTPEPWLSISIVLGALLLLTVAINAIFLSQSGIPTAVVTTVMLGFSILLFVRKNDFGAFKIAMFIQPFMLGTLAVALSTMVQRLSKQVVAVFLICVIGLYAQINYVEASRGSKGYGATEVPDASQSRINAEFRQIITLPSSPKLVMDTSNFVLAKLQSLYTQGRVAIFPSRDFFFNIAEYAQANKFFHTKLFDIIPSLIKARSESYPRLSFDLLDKSNLNIKNEFIAINLDKPLTENSNILLVATTKKQGIFNRRNSDTLDSKNFIIKPWNEVYNHLIFIHSQLGQHYYFGDVKKISLYQLERDWFFPEQTVAGMGRHFLFHAINPSRKVRLVVNMTASLKSDSENQLPPADAIGTERQRFPLMGRGSARIFSPPLSPQIIAKTPYLGIDMGVEGQLFHGHKTGLMKLYGTDIPTDRRRIVGFGRDISLVSDEEYANLTPPSHLSSFPADLTNPDLEYSGIYEDGWVSEASFLKLIQPSSSSQFILHGTVPNINDSAFTSELRVLIDGKEVAQKILRPGEFDLEIEVPQGQGRRRIDLCFSKFQRLQSPDNRPVAAKLKFIGFTEKND